MKNNECAVCEKEAVVYYAGDVKNVFKLIPKVRSCNEQLKKQVFELFTEYKEITSERHFPWRMPVFTLDEEKKALIDKIYNYIEKILFDYNYKFEETDYGVLHAVYLVLLDLYALIIEAQYAESKGSLRKVFYTGHGFGEFWAITKDLEFQYTMSEIIYFAYEYGKILENSCNSQNDYSEFVKFVLPKERYQADRTLSSKYIGKFFSTGGNVLLYANVNELGRWYGLGSKCDYLAWLEEHAGVEFQKSAPLYSMNLYEAGCAFAAKYFMPYDNWGASVIRMKFSVSSLPHSIIVYNPSDTIIEQIAQTFYKEFDEYKLFKKIERKMKKYKYSLVHV